jgi:hypothetical protein
MLQRRVLRPFPYLVEQAHRETPMSHSARGVFLRDIAELIAGFLVSKGVQQRHAALKLRLRPGSA